MTDKINARELVLDMLMEVIEGDKYSHMVLGNTLKSHQHLDKQERAFITRLFIGTVELYLRLDYIIDRFSSLPVRKMKPLIRCILRQAVYQIIYMEQVPVSAACNEAVKLAKKQGFSRLSGFVNGILRNIARSKDTIEFPDRTKEPVKYLSVYYSYPEWLTKMLVEQYGFDTTQTMFSSTLRERQTSIRCNINRISPEELRVILAEEGIEAEQSKYLDYAFIIRNYDYLEKHKSFNQGYYTVQDVSSMLVCEVAGISKDDLVLDVCAAPGGKTMHAAQTAGRVIARDISDYKISLIEENIKRMGYDNIETSVWDASIPDDRLKGQADIVIADLPCSGLGVIGRKPDIKYKLTMEQLNQLAELQRRILEAVQSYVKAGGSLLFCTCTVNHMENIVNRDWFLDKFEFEADSIYEALPISLRTDTAREGYIQLLQGIHEADGFFISKFRKK